MLRVTAHGSIRGKCLCPFGLSQKVYLRTSPLVPLHDSPACHATVDLSQSIWNVLGRSGRLHQSRRVPFVDLSHFGTDLLRLTRFELSSARTTKSVRINGRLSPSFFTLHQSLLCLTDTPSYFIIPPQLPRILLARRQIATRAKFNAHADTPCKSRSDAILHQFAH